MIRQPTSNIPLAVLAVAVLAVVGSACGTQSSKPTNTTGTSVELSSLPKKPSSQFPSPVSAALGSLDLHASIPLLAPLTTPANLSAKTTSAESGYTVSLYRCESQLPLNSPEIGNSPNCSGLAPYVGEFGGTHYPTAATASLRLVTSQNQQTRFCGPKTNSSQRVRLVQQIRGVLTGTKGVSGYCEMRFELNGWSVLIGGNAALYSIAGATQEGLRVIDLMTKIRMPAKTGIIVIQTVGDGNHTWLTWTLGQNLYTVSGYHFTSTAFAMAGSIAVFGMNSAK